MELRHLRFFVAVAEEGSMTTAAQRRLFTAQPSLSRQMRDLETEVGVELLARNHRGIELTAAGEAFLHHARLILAQTASAVVAAREAAEPRHRRLALGILGGLEPQWLPAVMHVLRDQLPHIEVNISSRHSPQLAEDLVAGKLDAAFMRAETDYPGLGYHTVIDEPLIVILRNDHRLAQETAVSPADFKGEEFISMARQAPMLTKVIDDYAKEARIKLTPNHTIEYFSMAMSVVAYTNGLCILPEFAKNFVTDLVTWRPLAGSSSIKLVLGYRKGNKSLAVKILQDNLGDILAKVTPSPAPR